MENMETNLIGYVEIQSGIRI